MVLLVAGAAAGAAHAEPLVRYAFDGEGLDSGPDTFWVYQGARGAVELDHSLRASGDASVRLRDAGGDGDFPELQGTFPLRSSGVLRARFALQVADPRELLNIALAGPRLFVLGRDGIAFWLATRSDGWLLHTSDSIPKKLLRLDPFRWYFVDVAYDVPRGRYDLQIRAEGQREPAVALRAQPNAANQPGSAVDRFSFIGDRGEDTSNVVYWVDDVLLDTDEAVALAPFVAPGRRRFFFERWYEAARAVQERPRCLPVRDPLDLGVDARALAELERAGLLEEFIHLADGEPGATLPEQPLLAASARFQRGCRALELGDAASALVEFEAALAAAPRARLVELQALLALAALRRFDELDARLAGVRSDLADDPRFWVAMGWIGVARRDPDSSERWLREGVADPATAERYFFVLLLQRDFDAAANFARLQARSQPGALWLEREGDAEVFSEDFGRALELYRAAERAAAQRAPNADLLGKLSDVHFALGDLDQERHYRERIYGTLFPRSE